MVDNRSKKFYWIKLDKDFFKRHDVRVIESMENGKDYILFYLKMLLESTSHEGYLRFNEIIPYDEKMLSVVTNTNIDIVRNAVKIFQSLKMMEILDDQTIYMNELHKMLGSETQWAKEKRELRSKGSVELLENNTHETLSQNVSIHASISNSSSISKSKEKDSKGKTFIKPTLDEVTSYCNERNKGVNPNKWYYFYESKGWMVGKNKMKDWKAAVITWEKDTEEVKEEYHVKTSRI